MFDAGHLIDLLIMGWLSNVPLAIGSIWTLSIFGERWWKLRGLADESRALASQVIERLAAHDVDSAKRACEESGLAIADMLLEGLRWNNVAVEDLDRVFGTIRAELGVGLKRGIWIIGTVGSLAPFVGLFGTVWGIMNSFQAIAITKNTSLAVVAPGIAEALFATALGLVAAIPAVIAYNKISKDMDRYAARLDDFANEFSAIVSRQMDTRE